jgi:hypothetical protein
MSQLEQWVQRCISSVKQHGVSETDSFRNEVIFAMEEGAERSLMPFEIDAVDNAVKEVG